jgi:glucokinase-like ROK family protein
MSNERLYIGIDLGGTFIKGGVVTKDGDILVSGKIPTEAERGAAQVAENIASLIDKLIKDSGADRESIVGVGIGSPGMVDSAEGVVLRSYNIQFDHFPLAAEVARLTGFSVKIANDANAAALGETIFGAARGKRSVVLLTVGTGVGGGVIIDGKLFEGNRSAGGELGHMTLVSGGEECTCGRRGCLEAYASATALIRDTKRKMRERPESSMWQVGSLDAVDGATAFSRQDSDEAAREVVCEFIRHLADGILSFANVFRPEMIIIGGGISAEGEKLLAPLRSIVDKEIFAGNAGPSVELAVAALANRAGTLGAAALVM